MTHRNELYSIKTIAKRLARAKRIPHHQALDLVAKEFDHPHWNALTVEWEKGWRPEPKQLETLKRPSIKTNMDSGWLDEFDPDLLACLTCHVELEARGTTYRPVVQNIATALREAAAKIENGALNTGFHDLKSPAGEKLGQVYLDFSGEGI